MEPDDKNKYDSLLKNLMSSFPKEITRELCPNYDGEEVSLFSESLSLSERRMDSVVKLEKPKPELFHVEFEKNQSDMSKRAFEYFALTYIKFGIKSVTVILFLEGEGEDGWKDYELMCGDITVIRYKYYAVYLSSHNYLEYVKKDVALTPLLLFMNIPIEKRKEVFENCIANIYEKSTGDLRNELMAMATMAATLKWNNPDWIDKCIDLSLLRRSKMLLELEKEAKEKGIELGIEKGMIEEAKEMVLEAIEERFGKDAKLHLKDRVLSVPDRHVLKIIHRESIKSNSMEDVANRLKELGY